MTMIVLSRIILISTVTCLKDHANPHALHPSITSDSKCERRLMRAIIVIVISLTRGVYTHLLHANAPSLCRFYRLSNHVRKSI